MNHLWILSLFTGLVGLLIGSFLNVMIYRLPLMMQHATPFADSKQVFNLFLPRSHCTACRTIIPAWHNIPLLSFIWLKGKCHQCKHPISYQYPLVEGLSMLLSFTAAWVFGYQWSLLFALLFIWILITLTWIDIQHQLLPDSLTLGLLWLGLLANTETLFAPLPDAVKSCAIAYLCLWLLIQLFYLLTKKIGMGHGDFKLYAAFGAWFGWPMLLPILITACTLGSIFGIVYLLYTKKSKETPIPFGPFLCFAGFAALIKNALFLTT